MLKKVDRLVCAWISLMLEKHGSEKGFELKDVLFTREELADRANTLFPRSSKKVLVKEVKNYIEGIGNSEADKLFVSENYDDLYLYCRLSESCVFQGKELDPKISELVRALLNEGAWSSKPRAYSPDDIESVLMDYFHDPLVRAERLPQGQTPSIGTPEAVWIAAATLAYSEFCRSNTKALENYAFSQSDIAHLAHTFNEDNSLNTCRSMAGRNCVKGRNDQGYAYLIAVGKKCRVARHDEDAQSQPPRLHKSFEIATISGMKTVGEIEHFIANEYSNLLFGENMTVAEYTEEEDFGEETDVEESSGNSYSASDFLSDVFMSEEDYKELVETLKHQKNVILCGAPGVGKTYAATKLAFSVMGEQADERVMQIQFHQSYSYEDFIMGYRPVESGGFEIRTGAFYDFCRKAKEDPENDYFFIIDEINRGNLSRIFGELFMLIENSKRGNIDLPLLYRPEERFSVPKNLYIIGMMNTADRSLAMLDYALRRRFAFFEMKPGFETPQFKAYQADMGSDSLDRVISCVEELNHVIESDQSLGAGFCIGHSYFCNLGEDESEIAPKLKVVVKHDIIPMLREYWFDDVQKANEWGDRLLRAI